MKSSNEDHRYRGIEVACFGASGFIGRWVARTLCARGANVRLVVRDKAIAREVFDKYRIHGDIFELDLRDFGGIRKLLQTVRPSITFNLAGYGVDRLERDEETAYQINARLVKAICEAIVDIRDPRWSGHDIVHVGSALEYGAVEGNLSDDSVPNPTTPYGQSKLSGTSFLTSFCKAYGMKGLTARLFTVYGPGEHRDRLLPSLIHVGTTGEPLLMTAGTQKRDFTYVEDVAEGLIRLGLTAAEPGIVVNLATGRLTSVREFAETAAEIIGINRADLRFGSIPTRAEEMVHSGVAVDRLYRMLSWIPSTEIGDGIRRTLNFEKIPKGPSEAGYEI